MNTTWDCIVVGGGAAGLSAALVLGRARRRTLVLDAGGQSNRVSHGIGGLLGHDTKPPAQFYAEARADVAAYPAVTIRAGSVTAAERNGGPAGERDSSPAGEQDGGSAGEAQDVADPGVAPHGQGGTFTVILDDGTRETTRTLLLATGMDYRRPELPGLEPLWGGSVFHCPFCHGWEHAGQPLGVLDRGESGVHRVTLLRAWSDDVTLLSDGPSELDDSQQAELVERGITVDERPVASLESTGANASDRALSAVRFADGTTRPLGGLLIPVTLHQRGALSAQLGLDFAPATPLSTEAIAINPMGATSVPGVFSAGDASIAMPSVSNAIAAGVAAAAGVVGTLML